MDDVVKKLLAGYEDAPWLIHISDPPSEETIKATEAGAAKQADYPLAPGNELEYLDDTTPPGVTREDIPMPTEGLNMYLYIPENLPADEKRIIYYIHGGGFMRGNKWWCRQNAISHLRYLGLPVCAVEDHYTPEFKYPTGIDDCEWGWNYLINEKGYKPENIIVSGESAGGTYTMALAVRLKSKGLPMPRNLVVLSGYLDFALESPSYTLNFGVDPTFNIDMHPTIEFYTPLGKVKEPEVSPVYADVEGFPPTFFAADDTEIFFSDSLIVADKMHKKGIPCRVLASHGLVHVYQLEMPDLPVSQRMWGLLKDFIGA
jgi:acetyl esterase/lipase